MVFYQFQTVPLGACVSHVNPHEIPAVLPREDRLVIQNGKFHERLAISVQAPCSCSTYDIAPRTFERPKKYYPLATTINNDFKDVFPIQNVEIG